jgi:predicted MPP superfamily phosphohydrolase
MPHPASTNFPDTQTAPGANVVVVPPARRASTRRPPRFPIEPFELVHPAVPAEFDGLSVLHLSDAHIRRAHPRPQHHPALVEALRGLAVDVIVLTGDFMTHPGDEPAALAALTELRDHWTTRLGAFAVGGNHDTAAFLRAAQSIDGIRWLEHEHVDVAVDGAAGSKALRIVGSGFPEDLLRATDQPARPADLTLTLVHYPTEIYTAARLGLPLVFCGHTHGGQIRPHASFAPHTSCDMPHNLASGVLRLRDTLLCISRGLGTAVLPLRFNCEPQAPLYTLRRGPLPGDVPDRVVVLKRW